MPWISLLSVSVAVLLVVAVALPDRAARGGPGSARSRCLGSFGGFAAQNLMPMVAGIGGSAAAAMLVPAVCLGLLGLGAASQLVAGHAEAAMRPAA